VRNARPSRWAAKSGRWPGTTVSVLFDGTITPAPRPNTLISIGEPGTAPIGDRADVLITQIGPADRRRDGGPGQTAYGVGDRVVSAREEIVTSSSEGRRNLRTFRARISGIGNDRATTMQEAQRWKRSGGFD